ncbi:MAG: hypothetical protein JKY22_05345 [Flavobacteriaceae bacterium]|nr:hypothetical protein [Flavobacteriaceae bacterium]
MAPHATKTLQLDFAVVDIFDDYFVVTMDEGLLFGRSQLNELYKLFNSYFPDSPFGYISNRINDYTVDPTSYFDTEDGPWLSAIAIMCYSETGYSNALFEQTFYKNRPFKPFYKMEECIEWLKMNVKNHQPETSEVIL